MKRSTKIIFTGSLLLNLLLIGLVGGHVAKRWSDHSMAGIRAQLSPESRNVVGRTFQSTFREIRPLGQEARKARADMVKILSAKEFDQEAFDTAADKLKTLQGDIQDLKIDATREVASQLSVEDRRKMADRMAKMVGGGHERKVKRNRKPRMIKPEKKPQTE